MGGLGLVWVAVATYVIPGRIMQAEQAGRALAVPEQLLFSASMTTANFWFVFAGLALVAGAVGLGLLLAGGSSASAED